MNVRPLPKDVVKVSEPIAPPTVLVLIFRTAGNNPPLTFFFSVADISFLLTFRSLTLVRLFCVVFAPSMMISAIGGISTSRYTGVSRPDADKPSGE